MLGSRSRRFVMTRMKVLDPTAPPPEIAADRGPDAGELAGRLVGLRYDRTWRSFEWVIDEWTTQLGEAGADVRPWCAGNRVGEEGERTRAGLERFVDEVDVAIVGLGN
jgi:hypothetical protein